MRLPSLRQRPEDIPLLVEHILARLGRSGVVGPHTLALLQRHDWPGNVRELRNVLERAISLSPGSTEIPAELLALPGEAPSVDAPAATALPFKEAKDRLIEAFERDYLDKLLVRCNGNVSRGARSRDRPRLSSSVAAALPAQQGEWRLIHRRCQCTLLTGLHSEPTIDPVQGVEWPMARVALPDESAFERTETNRWQKQASWARD